MTAARDLKPGDRFTTPGGRVLTVTGQRHADLSPLGYVEVFTAEEYAPGEHFTAHGDFKVQVSR